MLPSGEEAHRPPELNQPELSYFKAGISVITKAHECRPGKRDWLKIKRSRHAGGNGEPVLATELELWREALDANLTGTFLTLKAFLPGMISRHRGSIITVASTAGSFAGFSCLWRCRKACSHVMRSARRALSVHCLRLRKRMNAFTLAVR